MLSEYLIKTNDLNKELQKLKELLNLEKISRQLSQLEYELNKQNWTNISVLKEYHQLKNKLDKWEKLQNQHENLKELILLLIQDNIADMNQEVILEYNQLKENLNELIMENMFSEKYDYNNAILSIHAGSGGKEAQDWASMLMRMYIKWAINNSYKCNIINIQEGEFPNSVKNCILEIKGANAFGKLKNEAGVHRLIRVSPFDSQNRRHTSFAAVEAIPEIEMDVSIKIDPKDIKFDVFRSSGSGGQHVNTTDSAVRLTHLPTGIVVECQQERSQHQNKEYAMKVLISKLITIKEQKHYDEISQIQGEQLQIEWGSQIRTYTFMPTQRVKDHRTNYEVSDIENVMNGALNDFIYQNLILSKRRETNEILFIGTTT